MAVKEKRKKSRTVRNRSRTEINLNDPTLTPYGKQLGIAVKEARIYADKTQEDVAEECDFDSRTLIKIEKGKGNPRLENLYVIIQALNIDSRKIFDPDFGKERPNFTRVCNLLSYCSEEELADFFPIAEAVVAAFHNQKKRPI